MAKTTKELKNNSPLREKNDYNPSHKTPAMGADAVTTNRFAYRAFTNKYTGFSRSETRNTIHDYKAVIIALNEFYANYAMDTGNLILLPSNLGKFGIIKFTKIKIQKPDGTFNLPVDRQASKLAGKTIYHTNDHTDGNHFRWFWTRPTVIYCKEKRVPYKWWVVKPCRIIQRALVARLKEPGYNWSKYHYITTALKEKLINKRIEREAHANT
jgi:hypothetical protein